jgi:predicted nucleic acid-binding protein
VLSIDTNILLYAVCNNSPHNAAARAWLDSLAEDSSVVISEFILGELYRLLRNQAVIRDPFTAPHAVRIIEGYRNHPCWRVAGPPLNNRAVHDAIWRVVANDGFAFRRFYDVRAAFFLRAVGVTRLATANVKDFQGLGFARVWNPLSPDSAR